MANLVGNSHSPTVHKSKVIVSIVFILGLLIAGLLPPIASVTIASDPFPGNPPITPRWAFEPWVWEDNTNTQASTINLVKGYTSRNIPVGAVIIDSPWETYYNTLEWDKNRYPKLQQMINDLHNRKIRVVLWITGFVNK